MKCEKCLYRKNCQFIATHKNIIVDECTNFKSEEEIKLEAIKEFAEQLKGLSIECDITVGYGKPYYADVVTVMAIDNCVEEISELPKADVVEVVRCKDCKHATFYSCKNDSCYKSIICEYKITTGDENFFCAFGEYRRDTNFKR